MLGWAFFGVFSLIAALATSPGQIVLLRLLIGLGMGGTTPLCPHWPPSTARTNTAEL